MLFEMRNISVSYDNLKVLSDISFNMNEGEYICVIGENGAGKSTLLKTLLGLIRPDSGKLDFKISRNQVGYLSQLKTGQKDFPASVYEIVLSGRLNNKKLISFYNSNDKREADSAMERLGISGLKNKNYRELSGGQQQRVMLARALCSAKKLLVLDEPSSGLDPLITDEFYNIIAELNKEGMAIFIVTHDMRRPMEDADKILHLKHGGEYFFGTSGEYKESGFGGGFVKE